MPINAHSSTRSRMVTSDLCFFISATTLLLSLLCLTSTRVCAGVVPLIFVLGGAFLFFGLPPSSFVDKNETCLNATQMARKHGVALDAEEAVAALAGQILLMAPSVKFFQFWHLGALHAGRCAQSSTIPPVKVVLAAARAAPRRVSPLRPASKAGSQSRRHVIGE